VLWLVRDIRHNIKKASNPLINLQSKRDQFKCLLLVIFFPAYMDLCAKSVFAIRIAADEKIQLYAVCTKELSWKKGANKMAWVTSKREAIQRSHGKSIVTAKIPRSLLNDLQVTYTKAHDEYILTGAALRYAKRSCKTIKL